MRYNIAFIGTSLTYFDLWIDVLCNRLQQQTGKRVNAGNFGMNGADINGIVTQIPQIINFRPSIAVFESSMNDAAFLTISQANSGKVQLITALKSIMPASDIFGMTMNPVIIPPAASSRSNLANYYADDRSTASSQGIGLIDNLPQWLAYGVDTTKLPDGVHPTAAAHAAVTVPSLAAGILPLLI